LRDREDGGAEQREQDRRARTLQPADAQVPLQLLFFIGLVFGAGDGGSPS